MEMASLQDPSSDSFSLQPLQDRVALALVNSQYERFRIWRYRNCDLRWNTSDALFVGWMPQRFWEGTRVPRSSLSVPLTFTQIESAYPVIMNALFGDTEWFECDPIAGTSVDDARQQKERLLYLLENPHDKYGNNARNEIRLAVIQVLLYGTGVVNVEHDGETGQPTVSWVDVRDIYVDPGCPTPLIDDSSGVAHRDFMTLDELESLRGSPGINLPPREVLRAMADQRPADSSDLTKQQQEMFRNVLYRPGYDDATAFGPDKKLEVLRYYSRSRIVWVVQRRWVMYNELNPYGFVTYCSAPCYVMPGRFYGMSLPDALEGNQKYAQAILNGHLDEKALTLNPPRARSRSANMTQGSSITRPGQVWEVERPKEDVIFFPPASQGSDAWADINYMTQSSQNTTGVTNMISQGMPLKSNASRTATGVQAQTAGPTTRLQAIVELIEDYLIVPMLYKMIAMDAYHQQATMTSGLGPAGGITTVNTAALKQPVKFRVKASSRMLTQGRLQGLAPFLSQYLMNGAFLSQLSKSGQTIDFTEFFRLLQDATGTRTAYKLIRPLTDEEKQGLGKPSPDSQLKADTAGKQSEERKSIANIEAQAKRDAATIAAAKNDETAALEMMKIIAAGDTSLGVGVGPPSPAPALIQALGGAVPQDAANGSGPQPTGLAQ